MSKKSDWRSGYEEGVLEGKRGIHDMLADKDREVERTLKLSDLGRIHLLSHKLKETFYPDGGFQSTIKVAQPQWSEDWRYDLTFNGSFSRKDLNALDDIAKTVDCYYELSGGTVNFSLTIPYKEHL